jgi:hypothetical protein
LHIDTPKPPATCAGTRSAVTNGTRLHSHVDGRTVAARRFRDLVAAFEAEIGGTLSPIERGLVRSAASLQLQAEIMQAAIVRGEAIDPEMLIRLTGSSRRILQAISAKAAKRKPTGSDALKEHLAMRARERAEASNDVEAGT